MHIPTRPATAGSVQLRTGGERAHLGLQPRAPSSSTTGGTINQGWVWGLSAHGAERMCGGQSLLACWPGRGGRMHPDVSILHFFRYFSGCVRALICVFDSLFRRFRFFVSNFLSPRCECSVFREVAHVICIEQEEIIEETGSTEFWTTFPWRTARHCKVGDQPCMLICPHAHLLTCMPPSPKSESSCACATQVCSTSTTSTSTACRIYVQCKCVILM